MSTYIDIPSEKNVNELDARVRLITALVEFLFRQQRENIPS